jgi:hypothetical protein
MRVCLLSLLVPLFSLNAQTLLQILPEVITECSFPGSGRATIAWNYAGAGPVQIRIGGASGVAMTGLEAPKGSADTGDWVSDGLIFVLTDSFGQELARTTAHVLCTAFPDPILFALAASSYFPLQVGNEWVYRVDSRTGTADHLIRRVTGVRLIGNQAWYVVVSGDNSSPTLYRADAQGRIYQLDANGREVLWLDPTANPDPAATLKITVRGQPYRSALGRFPDSLSYTVPGFVMETGTYVRGVGLVFSRSDMLSGSSGGFVNGLDLVYARIGGNIRFATPAISLGLSVESNDLDVSGLRVTNCAVPCYFAACGLFPFTDPPGTYKPCFEARVRLENLAVIDSTTLDIDLLDAADHSIFHTSATVAAGPAQPDSIFAQKLPLYSAPNQPVPPGTYRVQVKAKLSDGAGVATAAIPVQVR